MKKNYLRLFLAINILPLVVLGQSAVIPFDPSVKTGVLPNGFSYFIKKNTLPPNRAQLYLVNKVGSILEDDDQQGLAHFMEHMSFNGTKNFPKNELVSYLQKSGIKFGADLNAYTSFDETVYQLPIPTDNAELFKNGIQIMRDWAQDALLETDEIDKERGVIFEEKRLRLGVDQRFRNKYFPIILNGSRYASRIPIGTEEVLNNFKPATIKRFYADWYRPDLQAIIVVGDIDVNQVEKMIKDKFSDLKVVANSKARTKYEIKLEGKNHFIALTDPEQTSTNLEVILKLPAYELKTEADYKKSIIRSLFNSMLSARIAELSRQASPPYINASASVGGFLANLDAFMVSLTAKPGETEKGYKAIWTEIDRLKKFGFTTTELERAKLSYKSSMEAALREKDKTTSSDLVKEYTRYFLKQEAAPGIVYEYDLVNKFIPEITQTEVNNLVGVFISGVNRDIILTAPEKDKANLPSEETVLSWMNEVSKSDITAYKDDISDKPLLTVSPKPGKIVKQTTNKVQGTTELLFSNGVKAILKPTDFKNNQILFSAYSPGGSSLYPDSVYMSAGNAASLIQAAGVSEFNSTQLRKLLSGKILTVSPFVREYSEGISGSSGISDFETALQLTYLYFTAPGKDYSVYKGMIEKQKSLLPTRGNDPTTVFTDTLNAVLGNYNYRRMPLSVDKLNKIDIQRAAEIYNERFANATDFTFVFVGSFSVDSIKLLLSQYLGTLPAKGKKEEAGKLDISAAPGRIEKKVYKGLENKASVRIVLENKYNYSMESNIELLALSEIIQYKLIERLRELEGGVYSPSTRISLSKFPVSRYSFNISFGCSPANAEKLVSLAEQEIVGLKNGAINDTDLQKFVSEYRRRKETQMKTNDWWISYLTGNIQDKDNSGAILNYETYLKKLNIELLKKSAQKYLTEKELKTFILLPEV